MELEEVKVDESIFESSDIKSLEIVALLFQTGYLTIKTTTFEGAKPFFTLSCPNLEVRESFSQHLLASLAKQEASLLEGKAKWEGNLSELRENRI